MIALIIAGGFGTRFWPLSRRANPKQFLSILSEKSMIQITAERLLKIIPPDNIYVVIPHSQKSLVKEHLSFLKEENIIIEPFGMNTAPCIALAAKYLEKRYASEEKFLVIPADHQIEKEEEFFTYLKSASDIAGNNTLVTFGIRPDYPSTGYGYIEVGEKLSEVAYRISNFKEKPDLKTAESFLKTGKYFWNSGMFFWKISSILTAFDEYLPEVAKLLGEIEEKWKNQGLNADISVEYEKMPKLPIDIGIMEKARNSAVIPVDIGWSDIGSWQALYDLSPKDINDNVLPEDNITINSRGNYVRTDKFVALVGIDNLTVVETDDILLISSKDSSQEIKSIVEKLKEKKREEFL